MKRLLPLLGLCPVLLVTPAMAQEAGSESPISPTTAGADASALVDDTGLEEVVVTAQRREENLQRAAVALTAISGDSLRLAGVSTPSQLTSLVPSMQVSDANGPYAVYYLRGVGGVAANAFLESAVAFNLDGVYIGRPSASNGFFYDLERVEVVKGPQGTLYGRNATGGAVNVISKKPELDELSADVSAEYGNYSQVRADGMLNAPLGDNAALRAAVFHSQHDPYMNDQMDDQDDSGGRLSFRVEPSDALSVVVVGDYMQQKGNGPGRTVVANNIFGGTQFASPNFTIDDRVGLASAQTNGFLATQPNLLLGRTFAPFPDNEYMDNHAWGVSSTVDWQLPFGTVTLVPAYRESHVDYRSTVALHLRELGDAEQSSVELRLASTDEHPLRYILGAYYFDESNDVSNFDNNTQASQQFQDIHTTTESKAVFGRLTYAFTDALRLTGGVRYTDEEKTFAGTSDANLRVCVRGFLGCPSASPFSYADTSAAPPSFVPGPDGTITTFSTLDNTGANAKSQTASQTTWRAGLDWDVTDSSLLYASYETGFKAGGFFATTDPGPSDGTFKPESIRAVTVGSKNRFLDNRLQVNAEAFYWEYEDQQFSHVSQDRSGQTTFATENIGNATMKGVEVDVQFRPVGNTLLSADIQYNDAVYDSFVYLTPNRNGGLSNGTGCPSLSVGTSFYTVDCSGSRPPWAPVWTVNGSIEQTFPLANGAEIIGNAHVHYQTEASTGFDFLAAEIQESYTTADFGVTYSAPDDRYFVIGFVNNAFDETILSYTQPAPFSNFLLGALRPPRTYGIRVGVHLR